VANLAVKCLANSKSNNNTQKPMPMAILWCVCVRECVRVCVLLVLAKANK